MHVQVLLIDDNPQDVLLISRIFSDYQSNLTLKVAQNYVDATEFLFLATSNEHLSNLQLIILEVTISNRNGFKLLHAIKQNQELRKIPLIILTQSDNIEDVRLCYHEFVNAFIKKPNTKNEFESLMQVIIKFWIETISLPEHAWG